MQNPGHFEYVYRDEYFYNLCEWKQKDCLLFSLIFPRYCTVADGEMWEHDCKVWSITFIFALKHAVEPKCRIQTRYVLLSGLLFYALCIFKLQGQHTHVSSFLDMHCKRMLFNKVKQVGAHCVLRGYTAVNTSFENRPQARRFASHPACSPLWYSPPHCQLFRLPWAHLCWPSWISTSCHKHLSLIISVPCWAPSQKWSRFKFSFRSPSVVARQLACTLTVFMLPIFSFSSNVSSSLSFVVNKISRHARSWKQTRQSGKMKTTITATDLPQSQRSDAFPPSVYLRMSHLIESNWSAEAIADLLLPHLVSYHISNKSHMVMVDCACWFCCSYVIILVKLHIFSCHRQIWALEESSFIPSMSFSGAQNPKCLLKAGFLDRILAAGPLKVAALATQEWQQIPLYLMGELGHPH